LSGLPRNRRGGLARISDIRVTAVADDASRRASPMISRARRFQKVPAKPARVEAAPSSRPRQKARGPHAMKRRRFRKMSPILLSHDDNVSSGASSAFSADALFMDGFFASLRLSSTSDPRFDIRGGRVEKSIFIQIANGPISSNLAAEEMIVGFG